MPLQLLPMEPADLVHYEDIVVAAFADSLQSLFYPGGFSPEAKAHTIRSEEELWENTQKAVAAQGPTDAVSLHYMKVIDTDLGEDAPMGNIVGVSKWMIYPRKRTEEELSAEEAESKKDRPLPPGINSEAVAHFSKALQKAKRETFNGDPYIILHILVTHPAHHRRGVGAMHLKWGEELADKLELPLYLEASGMGMPLYQRWGYEAVMDIPFDAREFGAEKEMKHVAMVRPVKGEKTKKVAA